MFKMYIGYPDGLLINSVRSTGLKSQPGRILVVAVVHVQCSKDLGSAMLSMVRVI